MIYGAWHVSRLPSPLISIFGSARFELETFYAQQAHKLAKMFIEDDISVLTGGGPGIMEAASCGAVPTKGSGRSMGIGVTGLGEGRNPCVQDYFVLDYFFARKWLLTHYSHAFIVFPGGFGTLDELAEVLTLIQTQQMQRSPIILIGTAYWQPFMNWVTDQALVHGAVSQKDIELFYITDDLDKAFCIAQGACESHRPNTR